MNALLVIVVALVLAGATLGYVWAFALARIAAAADGLRYRDEEGE